LDSGHDTRSRDGEDLVGRDGRLQVDGVNPDISSPTQHLQTPGLFMCSLSLCVRIRARDGSDANSF
jgi:hypothetical protein